MPMISRMPFFANIAPHNRNRRSDSSLILGKNGQPSIVTSNPPAGPGDVPYNPEGSRRPEYVPQPGTQISPNPISATGMQTGGQLTQSQALMTTVPALTMTSATMTGTISSSLSSATPSSSFSSQTSTTTSTPSNSSSSTSTSTRPTALVSPASMHTSKTELSAPFYVAIILGTVCVLTCCLAFLAWWMRSRASARKVRDDDELWTARDILEDGPEPSLQVHTPHEESEFYLPASLVRRNTGDPFSSPINTPTAANFYKTHGYDPSRTVAGDVYSPMEQQRPGLANFASEFSVQESPRTLGRLQVANIAPGDLTSGDESSHGGPPFYSARVAELGPPRSAIQYPTQSYLPPEGDGLPQFLPSPGYTQRTPRERLRPVMENTPGIGPGDWHHIPLPDEAEPHGPIVNENPPQEGWASTLKSNFMTAFGTVANNRTPRPSIINEESDIPLGSAKNHWPQQFPDPEYDVPPAGHDPPSYSMEPQLNDGDVNGLRIRGLGGHPRDRFSSPDVSQSYTAPSDSQVTLRPGVLTQESHIPLKHNAAPIGVANDKSRASHASSNSIYTSESIAAASANLKNYGYGFTQSHLALSSSDISKSRTNTMQSEQSKVSSRKRGGQRRRSRPKPIRHESSSASSMISFGSDLLRPPQSGPLSGREIMAKKALLERRRKMTMHEPLDE
ncbi:hypothetical protein CY34DRAFT_15765 [Suillus luteus UH-Slu-Lm8-n1]|uniref:Unplaced genomic scaffold CY34scaffold_326, whole genome shotgun sequence n=1 Tax=Suillus luteus UH-Slu-Lm8-n1 TaxID=930992 RepID=A0A0D0ASU9_9AGAM|nr:hypothetical protein CY34DRAFT_15765 [Suillus luteus UH-Slu-Lm8-n1]